ncbi:MAG: CvpA family protein [Anaerolineae bacterium]|nr:CvpA family protein [Anaerolineae bacterium]
MVPIHTMFFLLVGVFVLIGSMRGWAKEILVAVSVILALFVEAVLTTLVPPIQELWMNVHPMTQFWVRAVIFSVLVLFGYASPTLSGRLGSKVARERLQDILLGFFLGLLNGLLVVGTLWFFLDEAHYGVADGQWRLEPATVQVVDASGQPVFDAENRAVMEPVYDADGNPVMEAVYADDARGLGEIRPPGRNTTASRILPYLPPRIIKGAPLYVAVALSFVFVLIVFV